MGWTPGQVASCFLVGTTITIDAPVAAVGSRPLVLVATSTIPINATIEAAGRRGSPLRAAGAPSSVHVGLPLAAEICDKTEEVKVTISCSSRPVTITMGDNGNLLDDIYEVRIQGKTVLTSSSPVRSISTTVNLAAGDHSIQTARSRSAGRHQHLLPSSSPAQL